MNLTKLFNLQKALDNHIEDQHPRTVSRAPEKVLALLVELGELANETRCFKFWSNKPASDKNIILEEYVDGIHFLLSIGLEHKIENYDIEPIKLSTLTEQFLGLYNSFSILHLYFSELAYSAAFSAYVGLGEMMGFEWSEVEEAYLDKNAKNHIRQETGY